MSKAIFIGSFDPWHNGHEERLINALKIFDKVHIIVAHNKEKKNFWFNQEERVELIYKCVSKYKDRVIVKNYGNKMIHDICHEEKIFNVFRGVKAGRTFDEEIRLKYVANYLSKKEYNEEILFVYDITSEEDFKGASIIKTLALSNKDFSTLVPKEIISDIENKALNLLNNK